MHRSVARRRRGTPLRAVTLALAVVMLSPIAPAQDRSALPLRRLLELAEANHPLLKSKAASVRAAQKSVATSQSTLIPVLMAGYQANYGTNNNLAGMSFAQFVPPISGPPSAANSPDLFTGSTVALWMNWQPYTFGQREAQVRLADAGLQSATADIENELFQHKVRVITAYLNVLTAQELIKVATQNLVRMQTYLTTTTALVRSGIRPSVDTALFNAEVARATVDLLNATTSQRQASIVLSQLVASGTSVSISDSNYFVQTPVPPAAFDSIRNPMLSLVAASIGASEARRNVVAKSMMPTLDVWGATFGRGSEVWSNPKAPKPNGLHVLRYNYGVGVQVSVPLLQFARIAPQLDAEEFAIEAQRERWNDARLQLRAQSEIADTALAGALAVTKESPLYYASASYSHRAIVSRYESGLANFADLQQAEYSLIKAETDNKIAFVNAWRALLNKAAVVGDLNVFLNQAR